MMFNPSHFFSQKPKLLSCKFKEEQISPLGRMFISGLSDREARKLSGARRAKRQTSARSANARATPGWPASIQ